MPKFNNRKSNMLNHDSILEQGFTLVELIVALVIGLIISAAAFQLFANSANSARVQAAVSDIQDAAVFSMTYMKREIAMANLGAFSPMTQESAWTGVVITGSKGNGATPRTGNLRGVSGIDDNWLTKNDAGPNNVAEIDKSDQLTIQYQAPFDGTDCEGDTVKQGDIIVERFFTRADNQLSGDETASNNLGLVLACDAGHYRIPSDTDPNAIIQEDITITGLGGNGEILVNRVDDFEVLLGVQKRQGIEYVTIDEYKETETVDNVETYKIQAPIVAVQFAVLTRGDSKVSGVTKETYSINGQTRTIENGGTSYARRVYQTVVNLRNSGGVT